MKEPFINHMFSKDYMEPWKENFSARTEDVTIYSYYKKFRNDNWREKCCEYCNKELPYDYAYGYGECDCEDGECDCEDAKDEQTGFPKLSKMNLQSILDLLPEGVKPSDVKISTSIDAGDMEIRGHKITFSYKKTFEADPEGFKAAKKRYKENYKTYLIERQKYDEWKKQQEIEKLEDRLNKLKK